MLDHLTHLHYKRIEGGYSDDDRFDLLVLPTELVLNVISYLDFQDAESLSRCSKLMYALVHTDYVYRMRRMRMRPRIEFFLMTRPTMYELYERRILRHKFSQSMVQPVVWQRLEMFELLAFMVRQRALLKNLAHRPKRIELVERGILRDPNSKAHCPLARKIRTLENYKIEDVLQNVLNKYYQSKITRLGRYGKDDLFSEKLNFFENFNQQADSTVKECNYMKRPKKVLQTYVIGNKVIFH